MDKTTLAEFKKWFDAYIATFRCENEADQKNINLKIDHTYRVCAEIITVGQSLGLSQGQLCLAEALALFHDVGRFEQYQRYKTFADHRSEDHAQLGIAILVKNRILDNLNAETRQLLLQVIANHNQAKIPKHTAGDCLTFSQLLRDADKLDIWKLVTDYYRDKNHQPNAVIELNLPDTEGISPKVFSDLMSCRIVLKEHVKNLNDFKLLQVGWVFDVHFTKTFELIKERHYLEQIFAVLPKDRQISDIARHAFAFLEKKTGTDVIFRKK